MTVVSMADATAEMTVEKRVEMKVAMMVASKVARLVVSMAATKVVLTAYYVAERTGARTVVYLVEWKVFDSVVMTAV